MKHRGEPLEWEMEYVYDHSYYGNVCSGFGGKVECEWYKCGSYTRCGLPPHMHKQAKHRGVDWYE